jgi:large subunit ribosomal protein L25
MAQVTVRADTGRILGSRASRRLRTTGMVPAVVYGRGRTPQHVAVNHHDLSVALHGEGGIHALINLEIDGKSSLPTLIKAIDRHPFRNQIRHVDFIEVSLKEKVQTEVALHFSGTPVGAREGGILTPARTTIAIEALPTEIPSAVEVDVSGLGINDAIRLAEVPPPEGVAFLDDPETLLATVAPPTVEVAPEVEVEAEEGAEAAEGEGAPEAGREGSGGEAGESE